MTDAPKGNEQQQWPLVTFALFAYNQEKYIREVVEGAFPEWVGIWTASNQCC